MAVIQAAFAPGKSLFRVFSFQGFWHLSWFGTLCC